MHRTRETPAGQARLLHQMVKAFRAEMEKQGFPPEAAYMIMLNVVMRLAFEEDGEAGIAAIRAMLGERN